MPSSLCWFRLLPRVRRLMAVGLGVTLVAAVAGCGSSGGSSSSTASNAGAPGATTSASSGSGSGSGKALHVGYFSFTVQNSYDSAMLAAVRKAAAADNVHLTVFDANTQSQTQYSQIQDAIATGNYDGFMVQAADGAALVPLIKQAIAKRIQVVAVNQVLGPNLNTAAPQVPGLAGSVVFPAGRQGTLVGQLTEQACASLKLSTCKVGYVYQAKASAFDHGIHSGFAAVIAHDPKIKVVAEGQDDFSPSGGLQAVQTMLQAQPGINVIVGSDQGMQGATPYIKSTGKKITVIGQGGSIQGIANVKAGTWFADVMQQPENQGLAALKDLVTALRTGKHSGGRVVEDALPGGGKITRQNVGQFIGQWTA